MTETEIITSPDLSHEELQRIRKREYSKRSYYRNKEKALARIAAYRKRNREKHLAWKRGYRKRYAKKLQAKAVKYRRSRRVDPQFRVRELICLAKIRARKRGLLIDELHLHTLLGVAPATCECCSREFAYIQEVSDVSPSLDRVNNAKGYVAGNVAAICRRCNVLKNNATLQEVEAIAAYMRRWLCQ